MVKFVCYGRECAWRNVWTPQAPGLPRGVPATGRSPVADLQKVTEPHHAAPESEYEVARRAAESVRTSRDELAVAYRKKFGNEISTDNAREIVSPQYASSREERTRLSGATQKPAGDLADHLFEEALRNPDHEKPPIVVMTAGGTGAGKTTALAGNPDLADGQFIYDSNLSSKKSSVQKIEAAKTAGNQIRVIFIHRNPVEGLTDGVLPRAMDEGRVVGLDAHARMYRDAAENFRYLIRKYAKDPNVSFSAIDNSRLREGSRPMPLENTADIRYSTKKLLPQLRAALDKEYAAGRISESVYRATLGSSATEGTGGPAGNSGPGTPQKDSGGTPREGPRGYSGRVHGGQPEPERPGQTE